MTDKSSKSCIPWADGIYWRKGKPNHTLLVQGETTILRRGTIDENSDMCKGTWRYGDFGEAHPQIAAATGEKRSNVEIKLWNGRETLKGILAESGKKVAFWSRTNQEMDAYEWMNQEEFEAFIQSGDPADAPTSHHKIQPEYQGKLVFISGAPGHGKSTTAQLLSRKAGYVYYEGDCFANGTNPYLPPGIKEPSMAANRQKHLKDIPKERTEAVTKGMNGFMAMVEGKEFDLKHLETFCISMCKDIARERRRMGGDWVIAHAIPFRSLRDVIREHLGHDLIFVVLRMSKEEQEKRIIGRHGEPEKVEGRNVQNMLTGMYDFYEDAEEDEENTFSLEVTNDMKPEDVVDKILESVQ